MTPEQNLWRGVVDRAVEDSFYDPRKTTRETWAGPDARLCLMTDHMESVYYRAHGRSIGELRRLLRVMWAKIDANPKLSEEYRRVFKTAGNRADRRARA